jgi:hypothetical protein
LKYFLKQICEVNISIENEYLVNYINIAYKHDCFIIFSKVKRISQL